MARALHLDEGAASFDPEESHMPSKTDEPMWWSRAHLSSWERVKEAVRRDWEQTKDDLAMRGGHALNQSMGDTLRQAIGRESIPVNDRPNPPHTSGEWEDIERAIRFGYAARGHYGSLYPIWSSELESSLARDWDRTENGARQPFEQARRWVRKGYEKTGTH
jgi:hypothetical protein